MTRHALAALALALLFPVCAQATDWTMDADASMLGFVGHSQGEDFHGRFENFQAHIRFDPAQLAEARFEVEIDLRSADTRNNERDETLASADFFRTSREPMARYLAESFRALDGGRFAADGELTLRGVTRPVTLEFSFDDGATATLEGEAVLDRIAFGVGGGEWADDRDIRHEVKVVTRLQLRHAGD
jgi:polyisoprenoid-binding protein YceI